MNLLLAAIAPVFAIILYVYCKDEYEKEPRRLLLYNFLLGAVISILIATILYYGSDALINLDDEFSIVQQFFKAFLVVAIIEEFSKYIIVRFFAQPNKEFNEPYDGIIYAVMVSMGFAATENIMYVMEGGYQVALLRAFTAVPAHATFAVLMGYFMGKAKFAKHPSKYNLLGLFLAVLFHGAYDFFLFIDFIPGIWLGALASLFLGLFLSARAIKAHQKKSRFHV